jgi:hypothetical protein
MLYTHSPILYFGILLIAADIAKISGCAVVRYQENSVERSSKEFV